MKLCKRQKSFSGKKRGSKNLLPSKIRNDKQRLSRRSICGRLSTRSSLSWRGSGILRGKLRSRQRGSSRWRENG